MMNTVARRALGLANIGIGIGEIAAAEWINDKLGTDASALTRVVGAQKLATGIGTLALRNSQIPSFGRIASNAVHIGLLAAAATFVKRKHRPIVLGVLAGVAALTAIDALLSTKAIRDLRAQRRDEADMAARHSHPF